MISLACTVDVVVKKSKPHSTHPNNNKTKPATVPWCNYWKQMRTRSHEGVVPAKKSDLATHVPVPVFCQKAIGNTVKYP